MNTGNEDNGNETVMKTMDFSAHDSSMKRECDDRNVNVMIKQLCAKSDVASRFVFRLSGMIDQLHVAFCLMLVSLLLICDQTLNDVREFETRAMNLETKFYGTVIAPGENESESNSGVEANNSDENDNGNEANATNDSNPVGIANTSPEVIDEAGLVSLRLTLEESTNMETDRTTLQDTLEGMYDLDGININEDTLEELKTSHLKTKDTVNDQVIINKTNCHTDVAKGPNSVDSKGLNCHDCKTRVHINKQNLDITKDVADGVRVDKGDLDDISVVPERQISMIQTVQEISQLECIDKVIDDLVVQVLQTQMVEKQSRSHNCRLLRKSLVRRLRVFDNLRVCCRLVRSSLRMTCQDTADEHRNTHEHSMRNTCTEHRCRDNTNVTVTTDERSNDDNDEEREQGEQGQGGTKAKKTKYTDRMQATTEQELRRLMEECTEKYTVHNGRIVTPETIKHLKNHAIVHVVDRLQGGGKKKGQKKQDKGEACSLS